MKTITTVKQSARSLLVGVSLLLSLGAAQAETWPSRPIKIVVPFPPGATPDIMARVVGDSLGKNLGQSVVVENKPGGSGIIAIGAVQNSTPDGYTLLIADTGHLAINPSLMPKLPYDPIKDFLPISRLSEQDFSVIVRSDSAIQNIAQLVEHSKAKPQGIHYGTSGIGSVHHIGSERLKMLTGANFTHVPYKGTIQTVPALLAGDIDFMISSATPVMGPWKAGKLKILARGSKQRSALMPDVPTLAESGVPLNISITLGMLAPAGTPSDVVQRLGEAVRKAIASPDVQKLVEGQDFVAAGSTPAEYAQLIDAQLREYGKIVKETGITVQ